jgi:hypothetical protein
LFTHTQNTKQQQQQQQHNNNFHSNRALKNTGLVPHMAMPILPLKSFKFDLNPSNLPYLNFQEFHFAFSFTPPMPHKHSNKKHRLGATEGHAPWNPFCFQFALS